MHGFAPLPDGGRLAFRVTGPKDAPPLLLVRPLGGSLRSWHRFSRALSERSRVIAFDARGSGKSTPAPGLTTTRAMARDAIAVLDHLQIPRAHVFGLSLGGMIASWLAIDAPERVARLVLAATLPRGLAIRPAAALRGLTLAGILALPPAAAQARMVSAVLSKDFRRMHPEAVKEATARARRVPASRLGLLTMLQAAARHDVRARLRDVRARTLVLVGGRDPLLTLGSQRTLLGGIPRAQFGVIPGAGHDLSVEAPAATAQRVLRFIGAR